MTPHEVSFPPIAIKISIDCCGVCRVLFWLAVVLAVTLAIHMMVLAAFLFSRWSTPNLLHFPRPELLVLLIALAAIAQGAASKLSPLAFAYFPANGQCCGVLSCVAQGTASYFVPLRLQICIIHILSCALHDSAVGNDQVLQAKSACRLCKFQPVVDHAATY